MNDYQASRTTFPKMPEEIFTLWLDARIKRKGWPPQGIVWQGYLCGKTIDFWQKLNWTKQEVFLSKELIGRLSWPVLTQLINGNVNGANNVVMAYVEDSRERFAKIMAYAQANHNIPGTIILLKTGQQYEIVDGNHRLAALIWLQETFEARKKLIYPQAAWIGECETGK